MTASNMTQPRMASIRLVEFGCEKAIQVDFSNDRHYQVVINPPHGNEQAGDALMTLAFAIKRDPHQNQAQPETAMQWSEYDPQDDGK